MSNHGMLTKNWDKSNEKLRKELRAIRDDAGLSQEALAEKLGVKQSFISKYERGERGLPFIDVLLICKACKTDPNRLIEALNI